MTDNWDAPEFKCAVDLILKGKETPNGYTEFQLTHWRRVLKGTK